MFIDSEQFSPIRPPDWRYRQVCRLVASPTPKRPGRHADEWVIQYHKFRMALSRVENAKSYEIDKLAYQNPGLWWAQQLKEQEFATTQHLCLRIRARLLAGQSFEHIARTSGTITDTIAWYSRLFFDVRDRLSAIDWVAEHVLIPAYLAQQQVSMVAVPEPGSETRLSARPAAYDPFYDASLLFYAYYAGPDFLDSILAQRNPTATSAWLDEHFASMVKQRATGAVSRIRLDDDDNAFKLMQVNTAIKTIAKAEQSKSGAAGTLGSPKLVAELLNILSDGVNISAGDDGARAVEGTAVARYDGGSAELRDAEIVKVLAGEPGPDILEVKMPPSKALGSVQK